MSISLSTLIFTSPVDDYKLSAKGFLQQEASFYGNAQYSELGILLSVIQTVSMIHQQNHWVAKGKNYYSDHLLFMRLYEETYKGVDIIAERTVGLGTESFVCLTSQISHMIKLIEIMKSSLNTEEPIKTSYQSVLFLSALTNEVFEQLNSAKLLTPGLEQTIGTLLETYETHLYLLKQRYS